MKTLVHKTVLLTGATGGIGQFIARALAQAGATVVCAGRSTARLEALKTEIEQAERGRAIACDFDLQNLEAIPNVIENIEQQVGPIDILINNAAVEKFRPFQSYRFDDIQAMTATNILAPMALCHQILPGMLARGNGHIVNISSGAGKRGAPFNSVYSATKAALINWSEALRLELANTPVNISVVCPGITDAGMFHALETEAPEGMNITPPVEVACVILQAIKQNQSEVMLDGLTNKVFIALCQFSPQLGDKILHKIGIVETNRDCAQRQIDKAQPSSQSTEQTSNKEKPPKSLPSITELAITES
ncbi:MAG: SDR family NAD(P)-dependent oxidoreductase [Cyanobacteria bacterium J06621_11]